MLLSVVYVQLIVSFWPFQLPDQHVENCWWFECSLLGGIKRRPVEFCACGMSMHHNCLRGTCRSPPSQCLLLMWPLCVSVVIAGINYSAACLYQYSWTGGRQFGLVVIALHTPPLCQSSYFSDGWPFTDMPSSYVTSHRSQLSLLPSAG